MLWMPFKLARLLRLGKGLSRFESGVPEGISGEWGNMAARKDGFILKT